MKTIHETPDLLVLENKPVWLALFISVFGLVFFAIGMASLSESTGTGIMFMAGGIGIGIGFNMIFVRRTQLTLDAARQIVELRRRGWLGDRYMTWDLQFLDRAIIQTSHSGEKNTHRAAIVISDGMDAGTHPLTIVYSSGQSAQHPKDAINRWLDSPRATP
jgi:hypothetical protein